MEVVVQGTVLKEGHPHLRVLIDGELVDIHWEQKLLPYGVVFLGTGYRDEYRAVLPAVPEEGRSRLEVPGGTDDPALVEEVGAWAERLKAGEEDEVNDGVLD